MQMPSSKIWLAQYKAGLIKPKNKTANRTIGQCAVNVRDREDERAKQPRRPRGRPKAERFKKCPYCEEMFHDQTKANLMEFCCNACKKSYEAPDAGVKKLCLYCGKVIIDRTRKKHRKYCCASHGNAHRRDMENANEKENTEKI